MTDDGRIPPGWYPDPHGGLRWYDGVAWTDQVHEAADTSPPSSPPSSPPPGGRGGRVALVLAAVLVAAVGVAVVLALVADDDDTGDGTGADPAATTSAAPTEPTSPGPTGRPTDTSDPAPGDPTRVVRRFVVAALAGDCRAAESYMTPYFVRREGGCDPDDLRGSGGGVDYRIGRSFIEPGAASVPVTLVVPGGRPPADELHYDVRLVVVDDAWEIDDLSPRKRVR